MASIYKQRQAFSSLINVYLLAAHLGTPVVGLAGWPTQTTLQIPRTNLEARLDLGYKNVL